MKKVLEGSNLIKSISVLFLSISLLQGCEFDKDSKAPNYAADPHCANIVQQLHAYDAVNQPSKKITPIEQAKMLKEYQAYNCDNLPNS
jgi:hypothetical protein